jgi:hypothetical protein
MAFGIHVFVHSVSTDDIYKALTRLIQLGERTMTAITDFAAKQAAHNAKVAADLGAISTKIADLNTLVATLQTSPGAISAEDQATLDKLEAAGKDLEVKADALAGVTPPAPPVA